MIQYYNSENIILYFTIFSFLGWLAETIYCYIIDKKFTYRGFLYGPVCPIYGTGALIVIFALNRFNNNIVLLFIFGVLLTSTLEYITSYVLEKIFHMKWWDYSTYKFNLNGRICLLNSTLFGILSVVLMRVINPMVIDLVKLIPVEFVPRLSKIIFDIFVIDSILTTAHLLKLKEKLKNIKNIKKELQKIGVIIKSYEEDEIKKLKEEFKNKEVNSLLLKLENHLDDSYKYRRILTAFPNSKHKYDKEGLEHLKDRIKK